LEAVIMGINTGRVVTGGLVAGSIRLVGDGITTALIFAPIYGAEMARVSPAPPAPSAMIGVVTINLLLGIALVFVYAAMRPRFGPGSGTAVRAGLTLWSVAALVWGVTVTMGIFSLGFWIARSIGSLVTVLLAAYVGAMLYKEAEDAPRAAPSRERPAAAPTL